MVAGVSARNSVHYADRIRIDEYDASWDLQPSCMRGLHKQRGDNMRHDSDTDHQYRSGRGRLSEGRYSKLPEGNAANAYRLVSNGRLTFNLWQEFIRIDHQLTAKHGLTFRYIHG